MNNLIIYLGFFYLLLGFIFLIIPLIYLELGKPKDIITAALNLLVGIILIIKNKIFENLSFVIIFLFSFLFVFYLAEIFSSRWNQLTDKEKNKLKTIVEFRNNLLKIFEAINLGLNNFQNLQNFFKFGKKNENINKKKWVRNDQNDNIQI